MLTNHPLLERRPAAPAVVLGLLVGILSFAVMGAILFQVLPPHGIMITHFRPRSIGCCPTLMASFLMSGRLTSA